MAVTVHSTRVQGLSLPDRPRQPRIPCRVPTSLGPCMVLCQHPARVARDLIIVEATAQVDGAVHEGSRTKRSHMQAQSESEAGELGTAAANAMSAWLASSGCDLPPAALAMHMETSSLAWADGQQPAGELVVAGTILPDAHGTRTAVVALAARLDTAAPGMNNNLDDVQLRAHWACTTGQGRGWKPPPSGWHTQPAESSDAGGGAWQTTLPKTGDMRTMVLQIPLTGPLERHGSGLALVFNTGCGHWLKQSMEHGGVGDVFYPTDSMPSVDEKQLSSSGPQTAAAPASSAGSDSSKGKEAHKPEASKPAQQPAQPKLKARTATPVAPQVASLGVTDGAALDQFIAKFTYVRRKADEMSVGGNVGHKIEPCGWMVDNVGNREPGAQRSLMHRYNEATELADGAAAVGDWNERLAAVCGLAVWLRFSAMRLLTWNKNYNIKPREISAAQDRLCTRLCELWAASGRNQGPEVRPLVRLALSSVGRGGQGDVGQRVRDEILVVQQKNNCKGGMMEEWHQKLHNNTSPDDVVICEALIAYCNSGLDMSVYWKHLHANNIDANRLASYDRSIRNEPKFSQDQVPGLVKDLTAYLHTLRAVHCGTDLASAAGNVLGYKAQDLMKGNRNVNIEPVPNVATQELRMLLAAALQLQHVLQTGGSKNSPQGVLYGTTRLMELLGEARHMIRHAVLGGDSTCGGRHRDVVFLDIALEGATRSALESAIGPLRDSAKAVLAQPPSKGDADFVVDYQDSRNGKTPTGLRDGSVALLESLVPVTPGRPAGEVSSTQRISLLLEATSLAVESATLSSYPNEELSLGIKWLSVLQSMQAGEQQRDRALLALSAIDRLKRTLDTQSSALASQLQPTAWAMGQRLGLPEHAINIFSEEAVRGTAVAPLSQLLGVVEPCLRRLVGSGEWQVVSRGPAERQEGVVGVVVTQSRLEDVQYKTYDRPTVLVVDILQGHEEVPEGCVAVISANGQCPDMLSHSAVRARNMDVLLAACYNEQAGDRVRQMNGQQVRVQLMGQEVKINKA